MITADDLSLTFAIIETTIQQSQKSAMCTLNMQEAGSTAGNLTGGEGSSGDDGQQPEETATERTPQHHKHRTDGRQQERKETQPYT